MKVKLAEWHASVPAQLMEGTTHVSAPRQSGISMVKSALSHAPPILYKSNQYKILYKL